MASRSLRVLNAAECDISEAFAWYENRQSGLGVQFLRAVDVRIHSIQRSPETCGFAAAPYRSALVRRFPYAILYTYCENVVTVYAVFHTARDPQKWRERIPPNPPE